jgi:hypothetical protein
LPDAQPFALTLSERGESANTLTETGFGEISKTDGTPRQVQLSLEMIYRDDLLIAGHREVRERRRICYKGSANPPRLSRAAKEIS